MVGIHMNTCKLCFARLPSTTNLVRIHTATQLWKQTPRNLKGKKVTSQKWLGRQLSDPYVKRARMESYRCRSAFKLIEIDKKHKLLYPGHTVIDCGAAPGSWSQVAVARVNAAGLDPDLPVGQVIAVDLQHMFPVEGATVLSQNDFTSPDTQKRLLEILNGREADTVLSDMAPNATGVKSMDHELIVELCTQGLQFCTVVLKEGGTYLCKLWQGGDQGHLEHLMRKLFKSVKIVKPSASRLDSAEVFLLGTKFQPLIKKKLDSKSL